MDQVGARERASFPLAAKIYVSGVFLGGLGSAVVGLNNRGPIAPSSGIPEFPWWALLIAFALTFMLEIKVPVDRFTVYVSLGEAVVLVAVMGTRPQEVAILFLLAFTASQLARGRLAHNLWRYLANLGLYSAEVSVMYLLLVTFVQPSDAFSIRSLIAFVGSGLSEPLISLPVIYTYYILLGPTIKFIPELLSSLRTDVPLAVCTSSLGVSFLIALRFAPAAAVLLLLPVIAVIASYRWRNDDKETVERLEHMVGASQILQSGKPLTDITGEFLLFITSSLRAEHSRLILSPRDDTATALVSETTGRSIVQIMERDLTSPVGREEQRVNASAITLEVELPSGSFGAGRLFLERNLDDAGAFTDRERVALTGLAHQLAFALENNKLEAELAQLSSDRDVISHKALHDGLTGLANREVLLEHTAGALHRRQRTRRMVSLLFFDLDRFKAVNDKRGHAAGDAVLVEVAKRIGHCVRDTDVAARVGGDEFAVLLEDPQGMAAVEGVARRLVQVLGEPISLEGGSAHIGASLGIAIAHDDDTPASLVARADEAMYAAKRGGRNQVVLGP